MKILLALTTLFFAGSSFAGTNFATFNFTPNPDRVEEINQFWNELFSSELTTEELATQAGKLKPKAVLLPQEITEGIEHFWVSK